MKTKYVRLGALATIGFVLAAGATFAEARGKVRDEVYRSAALEGRRVATIAVLPVVALADQPTAERQVEAGWVTLYEEANVQWMPAEEVRARLATHEEACLDRVRAQIWRCGAVDSLTAIRLARCLGVDGVLSVRVDRWEIADGGRAIVGMVAVFTGADGRRLWSIHGTAGQGAARPSGTWNHPALEPREENLKLCKAYRKLLARWAPELPAGFEAGVPPALLARQDDE